jgi:hypothetical protein
LIERRIHFWDGGKRVFQETVASGRPRRGIIPVMEAWRGSHVDQRDDKARKRRLSGRFLGRREAIPHENGYGFIQ